MTDGAPLLVIAPVFDDWDAVAGLLPELDTALGALEATADVLLVDDGSRTRAPATLGAGCQRLGRVQVLELRKNLGHQRAIAVGLSHAAEHTGAARVVVLDADGQDNPADLPALLGACDAAADEAVVFAARTRRSESPTFVLGYHAYRALHWLLTGRKVRAGNFSVVPAPLLRRIVVASELWSHYAASVIKSRIPVVLVPSARRPRVAGDSRMDLVGLVVHGLSAMAIYGDVIGVRLLVATLGLAAATVAGSLGAVAWALSAGVTLPAWSALAAVAVVLVLLAASLLSLAFCFVILASREATAVIPLRDYALFVERLTNLR